MITLAAVLSALAVFFLRLPESESKVVVLLSVPHTANVRTHTNVGRALAALGHQPYVLIPQFMLQEKLVNVEGINVIAYGDYLGNYEEMLTSKIVGSFWQGGIQLYTLLSEFSGILQETARLILSDRDLREKLAAIKPDLFVLSHLPPFKNIVILPYIFNASFVLLSPFNDLLGYRVPVSLTATPCQAIGTISHDSFLDRLKIAACNTGLMILGLISGNDSMVVEFAPHRPPISVNKLALQAEIYLVEGDHILDFAKPELPNIKLIGCTAPTAGQPLKDPFKSFVEGSKRGVAVVTFGSSVVKIPSKVAKLMVEAFEQQELDVVWRVNYTSVNPGKIFASQWIPQNDILAHPNTRLFVSHCGANGQYEALYHGVPMLCLPLFGDQMYNAQRSTARGFGLHANILELSASNLADLMKEVSGNTTYRSSIKKASILFRLLYKEPHKMAAFWIDHVIEYGGAYMRSAGQNMPLYQFFALDVLAVVFLVIVMQIFCLHCICCRLRRKCCGKQTGTKKDKKD
ncbi:unnamed protein product [Candidula unifasciata]|uniref:UDP-glucuronosyltransferase n=1 Tax=Candidula unifasciata TaxID=100452 RepID=A0A8S3ZLM7_9EUPU|nr:unnamed protein product [Candidula unifasciata]